MDNLGVSLLRYVDWYGDTVFNRLQIGDVLAELRSLAERAQGDDDKKLLDRIIHLAERCEQEPHLYLNFVEIDMFSTHVRSDTSMLIPARDQMRPRLCIRIAALVVAAVVAGCDSEARRFEKYIDESSALLDSLQERLRTRWKIGEYEHYHWDQQAGTLVFSSQEDQAGLVADITFVGSISKTSKTWLWAWANDSVEPHLRAAVEEVREFGFREGFTKLTVAKWPADEDDGWCMTAVAARVLNAEGAYRTEEENGYTYMVLKNVREAPAELSVEHTGDG